jgi:hypothetical protein
MLRGVSTASCLVAFLLTSPLSSIAQGPQAQSAGQSSAAELESKACGLKDKEVKYSADTDKSHHPTPDQPADLALIYVLRPTMMGNSIQTPLAVDTDWKGVNRGNTYFFFTLPAGEHYVCSKAENRSVLTITVEAGKTYFLQQHIEMGFMTARTRVDLMDDAEARKKLADLHLATWEIKK